MKRVIYLIILIGIIIGGLKACIHRDIPEVKTEVPVNQNTNIDKCSINQIFPNPKTVTIKGVDYLQSQLPVGDFGGRIISSTIGEGPKTFNPFTAKDATSSQMASMMYDGLVSANPVTGEVIPKLAKSVEIKGNDYIIHLRRGIKWSDGKLITADDVMFTWKDIVFKGLGNTSVRDSIIIDGKLPEIKKDLPTIGDGGVSTLCLWVSATKPIRVVDRVTAQVLADAGKVVYSGTNTTVARSDGQSVPLQEKLPASTTFTDRSSEVDVGTQDTHNWTVQSTEHHDAEGYLQAWDETIWGEKAQDVCNGCGYTDPNPNKVLEHCENACAGSGYSTQKVRTGTIHHEEWIEETAAYLNLGITKTRELMKENEKIFVVKIGNRNYAHKLLLDKWLLAQVKR